MSVMFDLAVIPLGEIRCKLPSGVEGLSLSQFPPPPFLPSHGKLAVQRDLHSLLFRTVVIALILVCLFLDHDGQRTKEAKLDIKC